MQSLKYICINYLFSRNIFILCFLFLIIEVNCYANDNENFQNKLEIKYGYPNQSIFVAKVAGKEEAITPMLSVAKELFERANLPWSASSYPAKRLFNNLKSGYTNFSILVRASSLLESCIFSKKPIYSTNLNLYYIGEKEPISFIENLKGKRIITIRGYSYGKLLKFITNKENNITNVVTNTHAKAFEMLKLERGDYLLDYASAADDIISKNPILNLQSNKINQLDIFLVLSKSYPNASELMNRFETIIDSMDIKKVMQGK